MKKFININIKKINIKIYIKKIINNQWIITVVSGILVLFVGYFIFNQYFDRQERIRKIQNKIDRSIELFAEDAEKEYKDIIEDLDPADSKLYIQAYSWLGITYGRLAQTQNNEDYLRKSLIAFNEALKVATLEKYPEEYGNIQQNLGSIYVALSQIRTPEENINKSINAYREALKVWTKEKNPALYAGIQDGLGNSYLGLSLLKDKKKNLDNAIVAYKNALEVYSDKKKKKLLKNIENHEQYAHYQANLGQAYLNYPENKDENIDKAIDLYKEALKIFNAEKYPIGYATTKYQLGTAYKQKFLNDYNKKSNVGGFVEKLLGGKQLKEGESVEVTLHLSDLFNAQGNDYDIYENLLRAKDAFIDVLEIYKQDEYPDKYADTQKSLGDVYGAFYLKDKDLDSLNKEIESYNNALKIYSLEKHPLDYAYTQDQLGYAYSILAELPELKNKDTNYIYNITNYKLAIEAHKKALLVYTFEKYPAEFGRINKQIGYNYEGLAVTSSGSSIVTNYLEQSKFALEQALRYYTENNDPKTYKEVQEILKRVNGLIKGQRLLRMFELGNPQLVNP